MTFQVLSLSGGGFLGLYTASVLAELAQRTIRGMASDSYQAVLNHPTLNAILAHRAPEPTFFYRTGDSEMREGAD